MSKKEIIIIVLPVFYGWLWEKVQESLTDKKFNAHVYRSSTLIYMHEVL